MYGVYNNQLRRHLMNIEYLLRLFFRPQEPDDELTHPIGIGAQISQPTVGTIQP